MLLILTFNFVVDFNVFFISYEFLRSDVICIIFLMQQILPCVYKEVVTIIIIFINYDRAIQYKETILFK